LGAVIDRAAILGNGKCLEIAKALGTLDNSSPPSRSRPAVSTKASPEGNDWSLDQAMRRHIEAALAATKGRIEGRRGAAALLQINPHTLRARMRKLRIDWSRFRD